MTHKWDYEPSPFNNLWESMPFWVRWPAAVLFVLYFGGALLVPFLLYMR